MNMKTEALQYVKNTNGGGTKAHFIDDFEPVGSMLWNDIAGLVREDENGRIWLTEAGEAELAAQRREGDAG